MIKVFSILFLLYSAPAFGNTKDNLAVEKAEKALYATTEWKAYKKAVKTLEKSFSDTKGRQAYMRARKALEATMEWRAYMRARKVYIKSNQAIKP